MTNFKDINLQVGTNVQLTLQRGRMFYSEIIGYVDEEYLIIKTPFEHGLTVQVQVGELLTLRLVSGVDIISFTSKVKAIFTAPLYHLLTSFPLDIKSTTLRSSIRGKVNLPVQVNGIAEAGVIFDISVSGAGVIADKALGELDGELLLFFKFALKTSVQITHITTRATIRTIRELPGKTIDAPPRFSHGLQFHEVEATSQLKLTILIFESMNRL